MYKFFSLFIVLSLILSCSSEKPADIAKKKPAERRGIDVSKTVPPAAAGSLKYLLEITPSDASRGSLLSLKSKGFSLSDAEIEWTVNGNPVIGETSAQIKALGTKKGDTVQARAVVKGREILSNSIKIKNAAPELARIKIMPEIFKVGDTLYVDVVGNDIDGDEVTIMYEWAKNGTPAGTEKQIGVPVKRGDKISIKITPFDGENYGQPVVLRREIGNLPPVIIEDKEFIFNGKRFLYQVKASDPDNDPLTYSLKAAPPGMAVEKTSGLIKWDVPVDFKGKASVTVIVNDGHGGESIYTFAFSIEQANNK